MAAQGIKPRSAAARARWQRQTREANEQLVLSGMRQHELTEAAEDLNARLQAEITERQKIEETLRGTQAQLADRADRLEEAVTERTTALTAAHARLLAQAGERKRLEGQIAQAVESEQLRLGQELHDGLAQELTAGAVMLYTLECKLGKLSPARARELRKVRLMLSGTVKKALNLAGGFYPVELEQHGLLVALQALARRTQESFGVSCAVENGGSVPAALKDARAIQLFRIAQEATHNSGKHARARHIVIRVAARDNSWQLTVKDDGIGLPRTRRRTGGMGLHIMQYRARLIGGTLEVRNAEGGGVLVSCLAPEPKAQPQE